MAVESLVGQFTAGLTSGQIGTHAPAPGLFSRILERADSWKNLITGAGDGPRTRYRHMPGVRMSDQELEELYYDDAFASRVVGEVPSEALRRGFTVNATFDTARPTRSRSATTSGEDIEGTEAIGKHLAAAHVPGKLGEAWTWGRLYGGGGLIVGADDGYDPQEPINLKALRGVDYITVVDARELAPLEWYTDTRAPNFGEPRVYQLTQQGGVSVNIHRIHATRVIRFDGALTNRSRRMANRGWSVSELQRVMTALRKFNGSYEAVDTLLQEASQGVFGIKGLWEKMAGDGEDDLKKRLAIMDLSRSVARSIMIDKDDESFTRTEVGALAGIADVMKLFVLLLAGASGIPVTVLMGQAPAGLAATGDSDVRMFYGRIASARTNYLEPKIMRLVSILCAADNGPTNGVTPRLDVVFPSMWEETPKETGDRRLQQQQVDAGYIMAQVLTPEEVRENRFREGGYSEETVLDLESSDAASGADPGGEIDGMTDPAADPAAAPQPAAAAALNGAQIDSLAKIMDEVAARTMDRASAIQIISLAFPITPAQAEQMMGETGRTFFSTPAPEHEAAHAELQTAHAALQKSHTSRGTMLSNVLAENKAGRLVQGSPIVRKQAAEGAPLPPADGTPMPTHDSLDAMREHEATATKYADKAASRAAGGGSSGTGPGQNHGPDGRFDSATADVVRFDADPSDGLAIVLPLPLENAAGITLAGMVPNAELHATLVFLGRADAYSDDQRRMIGVVVQTWADSMPPLVGMLSGVGRFMGVVTGADMDPVYLTPSCQDLAHAREELVDALGAIGVQASGPHGFIPHVCYAYIPRDAVTPWPGVAKPDVTFDRVEIWAGLARESFPLRGDAFTTG